MIPQTAVAAILEWTVTGALDNDETSLLVYGEWSDLPDDSAINCTKQPRIEKHSMLINASDQSAVNGTGYFSQNSPYPAESQSGSDDILCPIFCAALHVLSTVLSHDAR
jgi:hypothetical protein